MARVACQIKYYLKVFAKCRNAVFCGNSCSCTVPHYLAVANKLEKAGLQLSSDTITHASAKHIIPVKRAGLHVIAFPLTCICKVCVCFMRQCDRFCLPCSKQS